MEHGGTILSKNLDRFAGEKCRGTATGRHVWEVERNKDGINYWCRQCAILLDAEFVNYHGAKP